MRRILLPALLGAALTILPASALAKKPPTIKPGTYKATADQTKFNFTLKRGKCTTTPGQGTPATHLCVSLPVAPVVECHGPLAAQAPLSSFSTPVALSSAGKASEHGTVTTTPALPGGAPSTGTSVFSVAFTKKGTASGYLELNLNIGAGQINTTCTSGKLAFTAKLG
jgi:hypothetical protein